MGSMSGTSQSNPVSSDLSKGWDLCYKEKQVKYKADRNGSTEDTEKLLIMMIIIIISVSSTL